MAEIEIPKDLVLPQPRDEYERQLFLALQENHRKVVIALEMILEELP